MPSILHLMSCFEHSQVSRPFSQRRLTLIDGLGPVSSECGSRGCGWKGEVLKSRPEEHDGSADSEMSLGIMV